MVQYSSIEWTDVTWNPLAGCSIISPGCRNCYAMRMAGRLALMGQEKYQGVTRRSGGRSVWTGMINVDHKTIAQPFRWHRGRLIFVNSMSDLFHDAVSLDTIMEIFAVMRETPQHIYQILTKRAERLTVLPGSFDWPGNVWMGVSVENADYQGRIESLRRTGAQTKFLSLEPLLGPLSVLDLAGIDWVIVGGESGPGARPMAPEWVRSIRDQCTDAGVPFHFKQWGGVNKKKNGRELDGQTWDQFPSRLHRLGRVDT